MVDVSYLSLVHMLSEPLGALALHDRESGLHSLAVGKIVPMLMEVLRYDKEQVFTGCVAGLLHDMGKIGVPREILRKSARLTQDECDTAKEHVRYGVKILTGGVAPEIVQAVAEHHECRLRNPYPRASRQPSHLGQILALADMYDRVARGSCFSPPAKDEDIQPRIESDYGGDARFLKGLLCLHDAYRAMRGGLPGKITREAARGLATLGDLQQYENALEQHRALIAGEGSGSSSE